MYIDITSSLYRWALPVQHGRTMPQIGACAEPPDLQRVGQKTSVKREMGSYRRNRTWKIRLYLILSGLTGTRTKGLR
jgi:hypothetical protein